MERFPKADAGELALRYNSLVRREACHKVATSLHLSDHLRMARGERATGGATKPAILADACEAVIGALFVDGGLDAARRFVEKFWTPMLEEQAGADKDPKTLLQEWAHRKKIGPPTYNMVATDGPPHAPTFLVEAVVPGLGSSSGRGNSKRIAEQEAAAALLQVGMTELGA
jgi:ribonuclease-3